MHSAEALKKAISASEILFGNATEDVLRELDEKTLLSVFNGVPQFEVTANEIVEGVGIVDFLSQNTQIFPSKGEARKMIQGNGVAINKSKVDLEKMIGTSDLLNNKYILAQRGKKNYFLIIVK